MPSRHRRIKDRVIRMNNAWAQGARTVVFKGMTQAGFQSEISALANDEQEIAEMAAQLKLRRVALEARYTRLNDESIKLRDGVEGHEDFGPDHPMYEAMGFVRTSERKSGLTRKKTQAAQG